MKADHGWRLFVHEKCTTYAWVFLRKKHRGKWTDEYFHVTGYPCGIHLYREDGVYRWTEMVPMGDDLSIELATIASGATWQELFGKITQKLRRMRAEMHRRKLRETRRDALWESLQDAVHEMQRFNSKYHPPSKEYLENVCLYQYLEGES